MNTFVAALSMVLLLSTLIVVLRRGSNEIVGGVESIKDRGSPSLTPP